MVCGRLEDSDRLEVGTGNLRHKRLRRDKAKGSLLSQRLNAGDIPAINVEGQCT